MTKTSMKRKINEIEKSVYDNLTYDVRSAKTLMYVCLIVYDTRFSTYTDHTC